ncbi:hypothetical protein [Paenibacillus humicus]|uniref:hypothetical protein n=1 Tax=Paenibacillus humicus TaxID=412861 RepID=UPI003D2AB07B
MQRRTGSSPGLAGMQRNATSWRLVARGSYAANTLMGGRRRAMRFTRGAGQLYTTDVMNPSPVI